MESEVQGFHVARLGAQTLGGIDKLLATSSPSVPPRLSSPSANAESGGQDGKPGEEALQGANGKSEGEALALGSAYGYGADRPASTHLTMALSFSLAPCPLPAPFANVNANANAIAITIDANKSFGNQLAGASPWPAHNPDFQGRLRIGSQLGPVPDNWSRRMSSMTVAAERSSMNGPQKSTRPTDGPRRKVVEHLVLFKMKDMTDEQEKDMLDHLYSLQYHSRGILAVSLGNVVERMPEGVTHAFFQRFPSLETLEQYMDHPAPLKVEDEFIDPYCKGIIVADFEAEVKDDLEALFRRGDQFQQGIEHVVLIKVREGASRAGTEAMVEAFNSLPQQMDSSVIVQLTAGANVSDLNEGYTHAVLVRVPSEEALDTFSKHPAYVRVFTEKVLPISAGLLSADFLVDPVTKSSPL